MIEFRLGPKGPKLDRDHPLFGTMDSETNAEMLSDIAEMWIANTSTSRLYHAQITLETMTKTVDGADPRTYVAADVAVAVDPDRGEWFGPGRVALIGDIPPRSARPVWIKRTGQNLPVGGEWFEWSVGAFTVPELKGLQ